MFADRHDVHLTPGGAFASLLGCETIRVNSLHGQGILEPGERVVIEGIAEDGTIEAIRIADAASFALGVQWHAEYDPQRNPINRKLFEAFGEALKAHSGRRSRIEASHARLPHLKTRKRTGKRPQRTVASQGRMRCGTANGRDATCSRRRRFPPQVCCLPSR